MKKSLFHIDKRPIAKIKCYSPIYDSIYSSYRCPDLNGDGLVNDSDLDLFRSSTLGIDSRDFNYDGQVDSSDMSFMISSWGISECDSSGMSDAGICQDDTRLSRGLGGEILRQDGFVNFVNNRLDKIYQSGFRRIVLQCPSGLLTKNILSLNIVDTFDSENKYHYFSEGSAKVCDSDILNFDPSSMIEGSSSFFESFGSLIKSWLDSKKDNVEIILEFEGKVPLRNASTFDSRFLSPQWADSDFSLTRLNPDINSHQDWFLYNVMPWKNYGISGISINGIEELSLRSFSKWSSISDFVWRNSENKFYCNNIPFANGNFYNVEEYYKSPYIINYRNNNYNFKFGKSLNNNIGLSNEVHLIIPQTSSIDQSLMDSVDDCVKSGFVPGMSFYYDENIDVSNLKITYNYLVNSLEENIKLKNDSYNKKRISIYSEYAGNTLSSTGVVSNQSSSYLRSESAYANKDIIPVIKVNCSKKIDNIPDDISRLWCPGWWFENNVELCIDESMKDKVLSTWTSPGSKNILKVNSPSPYNTIGPEKCADAAFDLLIQYRSKYFNKIDFSDNKNIVIKMENWGDLFDHVFSEAQLDDALKEGWCRLFTHYSDRIRSVNHESREYSPINYLKNIFANNGVNECSRWMKRFLSRWKWRQQNRNSLIGETALVIGDPSLIYMGKQSVLDPSDFLSSLNNKYGSLINHLNDSRSSNSEIGFSWREFNSFKESFEEVSSGIYASEFSVIRVAENSNSTFGKIGVGDVVFYEDAYSSQNNVAAEKFLRILISEVVSKRVYESFGSLVENEFIFGRYAINEYSAGIPKESSYSIVHAPFYRYVNRWQSYPNLYKFSLPKYCSFNIRHLSPSCLAAKNYIQDLSWQVEKNNNIRFEIFDYYTSTSYPLKFKEDWGWPVNYGEDPPGRGIYINGSSFDPSSAGPSHAQMVSSSLASSHVKYISHLAESIHDFKYISDSFNSRSIVIFSHGINNMHSNVLLADKKDGLGDFGIGSYSLFSNSSITGYSFSRENFISSFRSFLIYDCIPDFLIHDHPNHQIIDWNELSLAIENINYDSSFIMGDSNQDGLINGADLLGLLLCWNKRTPYCLRMFDFDGNGIVDGLDLANLFSRWSSLPQSSSSSSSSSSFLIGDANRDGVVDGRDLTGILSCWNQSASTGDCAQYDLNGDGFVDGRDITAILSSWTALQTSSSSSFLIGDANRDGVVDGLDLTSILSCWNQPASTEGCAQYDLNGDGIVDGVDITAVLSSWTGSQSPPSGPEEYAGALSIRLDEDFYGNQVGWKISINNNYLNCSLVNSQGVNIALVFAVQINGKRLYDLSREISSFDNVYAEVINGYDYADSRTLSVITKDILPTSKSGLCGVPFSVRKFTGFEDPFSIISLEKTVNDFSLIGSNVTQNFGGFNSYSPLLFYSKLTSTISDTSTYFTVNDYSSRMALFEHVSIDGEIISIKSFSENRAEILERGKRGTRSTFHAPGASVFGLSDDSIFDDNFYSDVSGKFLYQNRCIALRNIYKDMSVTNLQLKLLDSSVSSLIKFYVGFEVPVHSYYRFSSNVGLGYQSLEISQQNLSGIFNYPDTNFTNLVGSCVKFTSFNGDVNFRKIVECNSSTMRFNSPLTSGINSYKDIELLPSPSFIGHSGKVDPELYFRGASLSGNYQKFSGFIPLSTGGVYIPNTIPNTAKIISYNQLIYIWLRRVTYRDLRKKSMSSLPLSINFKVQ